MTTTATQRMADEMVAAWPDFLADGYSNNVYDLMDWVKVNYGHEVRNDRQLMNDVTARLGL